MEKKWKHAREQRTLYTNYINTYIILYMYIYEDMHKTKNGRAGRLTFMLRRVLENGCAKSISLVGRTRKIMKNGKKKKKYEYKIKLKEATIRLGCTQKYHKPMYSVTRVITAY